MICETVDRQQLFHGGRNGNTMECYCINKNCYFACDTWTLEEAKSYVETGIYPERLLKLIKENYEREYGDNNKSPEAQ